MYITFHEDIPTDYRVMACTNMKITQKSTPKKEKDITLKQKKWDVIIINATLHLDTLHIPIMFHEDIYYGH